MSNFRRHTNVGRVVYDRKRHRFSKADMFRVMRNVTQDIVIEAVQKPQPVDQAATLFAQIMLFGLTMIRVKWGWFPEPDALSRWNTHITTIFYLAWRQEDVAEDLAHYLRNWFGDWI